MFFLNPPFIVNEIVYRPKLRAKFKVRSFSHLELLTFNA